ncbi:MAG: alanine/glycine:cation symporter family protein [Nitrospinota bacterium]
METLFGFTQKINALVWGPWLMVLLVGTGIWLSVGTRFIQGRKFGHAVRLMFRGAARKDTAEYGPGEITPFQALMTALSATVGNGNIAGVATAIALGGPGAPVWMWLTGVVGMATKYAEAVLGVKYRQRLPDGSMAGGPMYFLEHGLRARWLGWLFALFGAITALIIGNMVQANSVALVFRTELGVPLIASGGVLAVLTYLVIIGGVKRIAHVAEFLVPIMCIIYLVGGFVLILIRIVDVPAAFALIFKSAFTGQAALGGFAGAGVMRVIQSGVARGLFSNEAGLGSASIAHGAAMVRDPVRQGTIAMLGVFIDTLLVNTVTTLAIVLTGVWTIGGLSSIDLTAKGFSTVFGPMGGWIVAFGSITFGYSTLLAWSYYGLMCTDYIFGIRASLPYRWVWCALIIVGAYFSKDVAGIKFIWNLADVANGAMAIPNLLGLLGLSLLVFRETRSYYGPAAWTGSCPEGPGSFGGGFVQVG